MGRIGLWVRSEWRNGWRALLGLTLLAAVGGGITIAAWAGARRADSAFDRFLSRTTGPLAVSAGGDQSDVSASAVNDVTPAIAAIPGVNGVTPLAFMGVNVDIDGRPGQFFFAIATRHGVGEDPPPGIHVVRGRAASAADEVVINEEEARITGKDVGDTITLRSYAPDATQTKAFLSGDRVDDTGPRVDATVVGVGRASEDISDNPEPYVLLPSEFYDTYANKIVHCDCSLWIATATSDIGRVSAAAQAAIGDRPLLVQQVNADLRARVQRAVDLEVGALQIAAAVAALASALVIVQALTRHVAGGRGATSALKAIGVTRPQIIRGWIVILAPVALLGSIGAAALATALSPLFPRGLARRAEFDPGIRFDAVPVVGGALALAVLVLVLAGAVASLATRAKQRQVAQRAAGAKLSSAFSPPAALGTNFALNPTRDRSRIVAITAVAALALAIGGAIAVVLIERSTSDVLSTPSAFGADWDMQLLAQPDDPDALIGKVMAEQSIDSLALNLTTTGNQFAITGPLGTGLVSPQGFQNLKGSMGAVLLSGRQPANADDVVLGDGIARRIGAGIGDEITLDAGALGSQKFRVSGLGRLSDGDETDAAFFVTTDALGRLQDQDRLNINGGYVRLGGADEGTRRRLEDLGFVAAVPPSRVSTLKQIGTVPRLLAIGLAVLGIGGVIHGLLVAGSRRRSDMAVARALGFTPHQAASTVRWQGVVTTTLAAIIGVPLGLFVGRVVWKQVASGVGAVDLVSIPWPALVAVPFAAYVAVTVVASVIGRRTARVHPATVLRSE